MVRISFKRISVIDCALVFSPLLATVALFIWLSKYTLSQGPSVDASLGNPLGFLISNFVYDGRINVENIALSCAFLLAIFLFYPRVLKIRSALFFPAFALMSGAMTEVAAEIACHGSCSFYGMSGIAGGIIGFTLANFSIAMMGTLVPRVNAAVIEDAKLVDKLPRSTVPALFVAYVILLFLLSGFFAVHPVSNGNPFPVSVQVPVSIATESQPVEVGHTSGILIGFLLYLAMFLSLGKDLVDGPRHNKHNQS